MIDQPVGRGVTNAIVYNDEVASIARKHDLTPIPWYGLESLMVIPGESRQFLWLIAADRVSTANSVCSGAPHTVITAEQLKLQKQNLYQELQTLLDQRRAEKKAEAEREAEKAVKRAAEDKKSAIERAAERARLEKLRLQDLGVTWNPEYADISGLTLVYIVKEKDTQLLLLGFYHRDTCPELKGKLSSGLRCSTAVSNWPDIKPCPICKPPILPPKI